MGITTSESGNPGRFVRKGKCIGQMGMCRKDTGNGVPKGNGTFRWEDGRYYVGNWSRDPKEQNRSHYPSESSVNECTLIDWDPQDVFNVDLKDCKVCPADKVLILRSEKKLAVWRSAKTSMKKGIQERALLGSPRHAVGRPGPSPSLDLKPSAFDPKEKFWTRFPPEGSRSTPPHQSCKFKWKDYCPKVFGALRLLFNVDPADYMLSICGNEALRELSSPGKSGSFFYLTVDQHN